MDYSWNKENGRLFNSYSDYIRKVFNGRVQKISVDAGFTCPNRDGKKGVGGCTYCNNTNFRPVYINPEISITEQLNRGISFFSKKYKSIKYIAYFQSFTSTYASLPVLKKLYGEALNHPLITGLVISTRPDMVDAEILDYLKELSTHKYLTIEYGIESTIDRTLARINRCHTFSDAVEAIRLTAERNIRIGAHLIIGLPGESKEDILNHANTISKLPIDTLKLHQLQINKNTVMAKQYSSHPEMFKFYSVEEYIDLIIDFLELLNQEIIIERFVSESPYNQLIVPKWGLKNFEIVSKIEKALKKRNTWQGKLYSQKNILKSP